MKRTSYKPRKTQGSQSTNFKKKPRNYPKKGTENTGREIVGTLSVSLRGTGTVFDREQKQKITIESAFQSTALHGDTVKIILHPKTRDGIQRGEVKDILKRGRRGIMGTIQKENGSFIVSPIDKRISTDILVSEEDSKKAKSGDLVFCEITKWSHKRHIPKGCVIEVIGKGGNHDALMRGLALERGFDESHTQKVSDEATLINEKGIRDEDIQNRRDFRDTTTFTIDPIDAKDFDDALSVKKIKDGLYEIGVHIADVTHYVKEGGVIDQEAYERATSVYMVDRTLPMLPHILSDNLCSLMEKVDRLTMSVVFTMNDRAEVIKTWFGEGVIHSQKRFYYEEAEEVLTKKDGPMKEELLLLNDLAQTLRKNRVLRGAILVEQTEVKFVLDEKGHPVDIKQKSHGRSNELIEEFMILANETVAKFVTDKHPKKSPVFVYRIHDKPNQDRINELSLLVSSLGYPLKEKKGKVDPHKIEDLLDRVKNTPEKDMINDLVIRSMAKAIYSTKNIGHYGLALKHYCHFTSPIRRYPDLIVHRILKKVLSGEFIKEKQRYSYDEIATHSSERERDAQEAERTSIKWKQVEYMKDKIGQTIDGVISGITDWGIFVSDVASKSEGAIRVRDLPNDNYSVDRFGTKLVGEKTKKVFKLGDIIKVKVKSVDMEAKTIDYEISK